MPAQETQRNGTISEFYDEDTGRITEDGTGTDYDFVQHGAKVQMGVNEGVWFITVTTPSGNVIVKNVVKK